MKRFLTGSLSVLMLLSTAACARGGADSSGGPQNAPASTAQGGSAEPVSINANEGLQGEITVSIFDPMPSQLFLQDAAKKFEEKYPNTKINITAFAAMPEIKTGQNSDGGKTVQVQISDNQTEAQKPDYINKINTQLMSGQGPDLFGIDVLPYYRYATGGQLEDLSAYMSSDASFNMADYRQNILDAMKIGGKQYILPLDYNFDLMGYDPSLFTQGELDAIKTKDKMTIEEMTDLAKGSFNSNNGDTRMFGFSGGAGKGFSMFGELLNEHYTDFLSIPDKKASFNDGKFAGLLATVKDYEDKGYISAGNIQQGAASGANTPNISTLMGNQDASIYYKPVNNAVLMNYLSKYYSSNKTSGIKNSLAINGVIMKDTDEIMGVIPDNKGNVNFTASQAYAMNANSANKQLAWAFLKFLLSEDMQTSPAMSFNGVPMNINAAKDKAKLQAAGADVGIGMSIPGAQKQDLQGKDGSSQQQAVDQAAQQSAADVTLTAEQQQVYDAYTGMIEKYTPMINSFAIADDAIASIINTEAMNFFNGTASADEVSNKIQNKVDLYINE